MKRSFLFFLIFSGHFIMSAQQLILKEVTVDTTERQQIKLKWLIEGVFKDTVMVIYKCNNQCKHENKYDIKVAEVKIDADNLEFIDTMANPKLLYYYTIFSQSGKSAPKNNMVLDTLPNDSCRNSVFLSWDHYVHYKKWQFWNDTPYGIMDTVDYYIYCRKKNDDSPFYLKDSVTDKYFSNFDSLKKIVREVKYLDNNTKYEFVVQAICRSDTVQPFSNIVEAYTGFEDTARISIDISCVSVTEEHYIDIEITTNNFVTPFHKLFLYRDDSEKPVESKESLRFKMINSLDYDPVKKYSYRFKDKDVSAGTRVYYYQAIATNRCRSSDTSNIKTNILLKGDRADKYLDSIQFTQAGFPKPDKNSYNLYRLVNDTPLFITDGLLRDFSYFIDITPFIDDGAKVRYQVKSELGCLSNILIVNHEPIIDFPDAFYPQSKKNENRTFYPIIKIPSEDKYLFIIYDRWGQELYRSTLPPEYGNYLNMQGRWDGTFQGKACPPGIYAYQISYNYEGKKFSYSGTFMLLR